MIIHSDDNSPKDINDESATGSIAETDIRSSANAPAKKLGFGLVGSGKRTAVASVFHEEEDDDAHKDKKMRPLVPIDYSTEELQAVQPTASGPTPPNLAAAAELAKHISSASLKEKKLDGERDRNRRSNEKSNHRDRDNSDQDGIHNRDENKEKLEIMGRRNSRLQVSKLLLSKINSNVRYSIWIDGKLELVGDPYQIPEGFLWRPNATFAISRHYSRFDVFVEATGKWEIRKWFHRSPNSILSILCSFNPLFQG